MDEQTAPQQDTATTEAPAIDNAALLSRMDDLAGEIKGLREAPSPQFEGGISDAIGNPQADDVGAANDYDTTDDFTGYQPDPQYGGYEDPQAAQAQAMQQLQQFISDQVTQGVQSQVQPWIQQQQAVQLEQKYPDLAKPEVAGPVVQEAQRFAEQLGQPGLATNPALIEKLYLAQQASQRAAQETPAAGDREVHLEGSGAGQPAPDGSPEEDLVKRVLNAGSGGSGRAFWVG